MASLLGKGVTKLELCIAVSKGADNRDPIGLWWWPNIQGVERTVRLDAIQLQNLLGIYIFQDFSFIFNNQHLHHGM